MDCLRNIMGFGLLSVLPVAVGQVEVAPAGSAIELCQKLVEQAREVDSILRRVSDHESGVAAAAELTARMEYMRNATEQLGRMPVNSGEDARAVEQVMRDLTHITQGYMQVVQLLMEVNAYGADELVSLFQYYKMSNQASSYSNQREETPLVRAYTEWCDSVDDMLFTLRRVQNRETAESAVAELPPLLQKVERKAELAERLQAGLSPQQVESERVPADRLMRLRDEVRSEVRRVRSVQGYGAGRLLELLPECSKAARI